MATEIKYPVGIQTFSKIREKGYLYVDKTAILYTLVKESEYVFLSRPRRFGKSLLMSTLEAYFRGRKDLFEGLAISNLEKDWIKYPVFRLDLSPAYFDHPQRLIELIKRSLNSIGRIYGLKSEYDNISDIFIDFIEQAYYKFGEKVVILIDEYDKPLLDCLHNPELHSTIRNELRGFFSSIKTCDEYIQFAMLTGVTKFGKVSIFSGLNNLRDISLNPKYNGICGITETEFHSSFQSSIKNFAQINEIQEADAWAKFKKMYDGYHFAKSGEYIYNPFCVLCAFADEELKNYWYRSGSPDFLIQLIERNSYSLSRIEGERRSEDKLNSIVNMDSDFIPLLFQAGYLTIKDYDAKTKEYALGFPNTEVYEAFWSDLKDHFFKLPGGGNAFDL
ncbi:MAG: AAA family ATPase [Muribaculaceae bacterium]|nr:AAA family ATPase [Muribaculaceae bacterium]